MKHYLRKLAFFAGISGILAGFSGCYSSGYGSFEPTYVRRNGNINADR